MSDNGSVGPTLTRPSSSPEMTNRSKPWEIAADLEAAAMALRTADRLLDAVHDAAQAEISECGGSWPEMADQLQALSEKYQAIADAEPDGPECPSSPTRRHIVDTSMESGPHNCFHCERPMR